MRALSAESDATPELNASRQRVALALLRDLCKGEGRAERLIGAEGAAVLRKLREISPSSAVRSMCAAIVADDSAAVKGEKGKGNAKGRKRSRSESGHEESSAAAAAAAADESTEAAAPAAAVEVKKDVKKRKSSSKTKSKSKKSE